MASGSVVCPNIIIDGSQMILCLDQREEHNSNFSSAAISIDDTIFNDSHLQLANNIPLQRIITPFLTPGAASVSPFEILSSLPLCPSRNGMLSYVQESTQEVPMAEFPVGEQVVTITQQVPIKPETEEEPKLQQKSKVINKVFIAMWNILTSQLGLVIFLIMYTFVGAAIFDALEDLKESTHGTIVHNNATGAEEFIHIFKSVAQRNLLDNNTFILTMHELRNVFKEYEDMIGSSSRLSKSGDGTDEYLKWLLFCITTYTTIGYGNIVPSTAYGKLACMTYSMIGIPLFLMTMGKIGKIFTKGLNMLWNMLRKLQHSSHDAPHPCKSRCKRPDDNKVEDIKMSPKGSLATNKTECSTSSAKDECTIKLDNMSTSKTNKRPRFGAKTETDNKPFEEDKNIPPWVSLIIFIVYVLIGAGIYSAWETDWSYLDAVYFVFVSISTIGFGDIVPSDSIFLITSVYVLIGLALVAMVISRLIEYFTKKIEYVRKTVTHIHIPALLQNPLNSVQLKPEGSSPTGVTVNAAPPIINKTKLTISSQVFRRSSV